MNYKDMREYSREEFVKLIKSLSEDELLEFSSKHGGYPVLFRMALDERINHIPFIQTGAAVIIKNKEEKILLQERRDRNMWGLPGGCQELGESLEETAVREVFEETGLKIYKDQLNLIDTLSGKSRRNNYPNGDIVYNNTSLYLVKLELCDIDTLKPNGETKRLDFFDLKELPENLMDWDLIKSYSDYLYKTGDIIRTLKK